MNYTQEQNSIIHGGERVTSVMGVPGCGKTTTLFGKILYNVLANIIIITRTNSVVEEIREHALKHNMIFSRINTSGHYIHKRNNGNYITITNIDAFIHYQLTQYKYDLTKNGDQFNKKKHILANLIKNGDIKNLYIKNLDNINIIANQIYIDEVQDMIPIELSIFINILKTNLTLNCSVFGDTLQTLTEESTSEYPIITFNKELDAKQYNLSLCFRCPKSHIIFNNCLLKNIRDSNKYGELPNIVSNNQDIIDKPFLFTHPGMNTNSNGFVIANHIINIISNCKKYDDTLGFGDISILVPKINECSTIPIIFSELEKNFGEHFYYFETNKSGTTIPIDFTKIKETYCNCTYKSNKKKKKQFKANSNYCDKCKTFRKKNKTCIISIDAFKGKESRLIIVLNLADKSIPRENHIDKKEELTDFSKLNVLTTRSTQYLFLGINALSPSRYFMLKQNKLEDNNLFYHPWYLGETNNTKNNTNNYNQHVYLFKYAPELYKKIAENDEMKYNLYPKSIDFPKRNTPDNNKILATDVSDNVDIDNLTTYEIEEEQYGKKCNFTKTYDSRILGNMGNLLIFRQLYINGKIDTDFRNQYELLQICDINNIFEIDSDQVYSIIVDLDINNTIMRDAKKSAKDLIGTYHSLLGLLLKKIAEIKLDKKLKIKYENEIGYLISHNNIKLFCHSDYLIIFKDLKPFLNRSIKNESINSKTYFNIAILNEHLGNNIFRPVNKNYINIFDEDISILHQNCNIFSNKLNGCFLEHQVSFKYTELSESIIKLLGYDRQKEDKIFREGYPCKIVGVSDIIHQNNLIEVKTSKSDICKKTWIIQVLVYILLYKLLDKRFTNTYINNILIGKQYTIKFDDFNSKELLIKILDKYKFIPQLRDNFIKKIINSN